MGFALIFLGLIPLMFLPDSVGADHDDGDTGDSPLPDLPPPVSMPEPSDLPNAVETIQPTDPPEEDGQGDGQGEVVEPGIADILDPVIGIDVPDPDSQDPLPETILAPADEIDTASGDDEPDPGNILLPVDEFVSEGQEVWLNLAEDEGIGHAEITGFEPGQDVLQISLPQDQLDDDPQVGVNPSEDGADGLVFIDNDLVAILKGAPVASQDDIRLIAF